MVRFFTNLSQRYQRSFAGLPRQVWWLAAVMLVNRSGAMVMVFLTIYLTDQLGWTDSYAGMMIATYGVGSCCGAFLGGALTARVGARAVQLTSLLGTAGGFLCLSNATDPSAVMVTLFCTGCIAESFRPANAVAIAEATPPNLLTRGFALNRLAVNLGFTFGPAIGGWLARYSYQALFYVDAATCVVAALVLWKFGHRVARGSQAITEPTSRSTDPPLSNLGFLWFVLVAGLVSLVFFQLLSTYPLYLKRSYGLVESQIGLLMAINTLIIVATEMVLVEAMQSMPLLRQIAIGSLLICEGFALLSVGHGFAWAVGIVVVWTLGEMISMPAIFAYVSRTATPQNRARRLGTYSLVMSIGFVIAPLFGTWCFSRNENLIWWIAGILGPVCWLGFRLLEKSGSEFGFQKAASQWRPTRRSDSPTELEPIEPGV